MLPVWWVVSVGLSIIRVLGLVKDHHHHAPDSGTGSPTSTLVDRTVVIVAKTSERVYTPDVINYSPANNLRAALNKWNLSKYYRRLELKSEKFAFCLFACSPICSSWRWVSNDRGTFQPRVLRTNRTVHLIRVDDARGTQAGYIDCMFRLCAGPSPWNTSTLGAQPGRAGRQWRRRTLVAQQSCHVDNDEWFWRARSFWFQPECTLHSVLGSFSSWLLPPWLVGWLQFLFASLLACPSEPETSQVVYLFYSNALLLGTSSSLAPIKNCVTKRAGQGQANTQWHRANHL